MNRALIALLASAAFLVLAPADAAAHCGTCGHGEAAADPAADAPEACAHCAGDETAECTCAHGEGSADGAEAAVEACARCAGDETAECTCDHGH